MNTCKFESLIPMVCFAYLNYIIDANSSGYVQE